ncbi:MAG: alpha/beta hydrolase [Bdellovibrionota bacterium]
MSTKFPFSGELVKAANKKYEEVIFFVHFFEGNKRLIKRHVKTVNLLGFDAFIFTLPLTWNPVRPPIAKNFRFGWKHVYADVISELLDLVPGKKIIFSFSNPSASAIEAMAARKCKDVAALICDSGPSARFLYSAFSLSKQYLKEGEYFKAGTMQFGPLFWTPFFHRDIKKHLNVLPDGFPILSIRGWKDPLIPPSHIDAVFEGHSQIHWRKLSLPLAGHLNGLRDFRKEYMAGLTPFLGEIATPIS